MYTKVILALILFATVMVFVEASDEAELKELLQNHMNEVDEDDLTDVLPDDSSLREVIEEYRSEIAVMYCSKEMRHVIKAISSQYYSIFQSTIDFESSYGQEINCFLAINVKIGTFDFT